MICVACGRENREAARFCDDCGEFLTSRCRACEQELRPDARFCDACGTPVAESVADTVPPAAPTGSRKVVTLVFADLAGSTSLQERMDAESVRRVMDRFYDAMRAAVVEHGGTVVKFMGDGLMAAFGVPAVAEDDAVRAVRAAAAMQEAFVAVAEEVGREWDAEVGLRVGVNTGEVVVAEGEDDVVGDAVNVAARLEHAAADGQVLVGQETWRLTRDLSTFEEVPPLDLKGKSERVAAYRLVALAPPAADEASPFVGRADELGRLTAAFEAAVEQRRARLVTVIGSPGLGKSRMVRELSRQLAGRAATYEGQCEASGSSTFAPVADVLRAIAGIDETASADDAVTALAALFTVGGDHDDAGRIATAAASILGVGRGVSPEETFWAVRRVIEQAAGGQPAIVVFDDVHWAEPILLDLLDHLAEWIRDAPVLLVALARPEIRDVRAALADTAATPTDVVVLDALAAEEGVQLAAELLQGRPLHEDVAAHLLTSAEGNPLFLRELVKMLVDDAVLHIEDGVWVAANGVEELEVPPTIHALLSARIERLESDERSVVERASVVGHQFFRGAVAVLSPPPVASQLDGHLETLRRKEVVEPEGTYWIDEPVFRFHHGLIRDAAYRRLLKEARADLHERVADWLALKAGDLVGEHEEIIGFHLEQAYEYRRDLGGAGSAVTELGRRAGGHLAAAARRALDRDDLRSAAGLMGRAVACLPEADPARAELLVDRCEALLGLGEVAAGGEVVVELEAAAAGEPRLSAWSEAFAAQVASFSEPEALPEWVGRAAAAAARLEQLGDPVGTAKAASVHASILARLGQVAACEAALDRALAAAREAGDRRRANGVLAGAPLAALWGPSPVTRAAGRCLDVVRVLRITTDSPPVEAVALRAQGVLEAFRGRFDAARRLVESSRRTLEELGLRHGILQTELFEGLIELAADDPAAAEGPLRRAYEGFRALGVGVDTAQAAALLARACLAQGRDDEALQLTEESERLGGHDLKTAIAWRAVRAEALARRAEVDEALRLAQEAVDRAAPTDALVDHADARLALAAVLAAGGDTAAAEDEARRAADLYEAKGASALVERARGLVGPTAPPPADGEEGGSDRRGGEHEAELANLATAAFESYARLLPEKDVEGIVALVAPDYVREERGRAAQTAISGRDELRDALRVQFEIDLRVEHEVVATRLDRLSLVSVTIHTRDSSGGQAELRFLRVDEADERGRLIHTVTFDHDDLDAAYDELDRRFVTHEGIPEDEWFGSQSAVARAYSTGDADGLLRAFFSSPDVDVIDHRPVGWGRVSASEFVRLVAGMTGLISVGELRRIAVFRRQEPFSLVRQLLSGAGPEGDEFELVYDAVVRAESGRVAHLELYDPEDLDQALARFDELTGAGGHDLAAENLAVRAWERGRRATEAGDLEALLSVVVDDVVYEERTRTGGLFEPLRGKEALAELYAPVFAGRVEFPEAEILATRGHRLLLTRAILRWTDRLGQATEHHHLRLDETDDTGLITAAIIFEPDATLDAIEEMNRRYSEAAPAERAVLDLSEAIGRAYADNDWDRFVQLLAPGFVGIDRRLGRWGELGVEEYVGLLQALKSQAPDTALWPVTIERVMGDVSLTAWMAQGTAGDGGLFELRWVSVAVTPGGMLARYEVFEVDDRLACIARFEELVAGERRPAQPANDATRAWERQRQFMVAGNVDAMLADIVEGVVYEERMRAPGRFTLIGRDKLAEMLRTLLARKQPVAIESEVLAIRGQHLALIRNTFRWLHDDAGPTEYVNLRVEETNGEGLIASVVTFEPDALLDALEELDRRFVELEGASWRPLLDLVHGLMRTYAAGDWGGYRALVAPDFVCVDHRPLGWGELDADGFLERLRGIKALAADIVLWPVTLERTEDNVSLAQIVARGTTADGGRFDVPWYSVTVAREGLHARHEMFALEDRAAAQARFEELTGHQEDGLFNDAVRRVIALNERLAAGDADGVFRHYSPDLVSDERRRATQGMWDAEQVKEWVRFALADYQLEDVSFDPMATRGSRLALGYQTFLVTGDVEGEGELHWLQIAELGEDGLVSRFVMFEPDDFDAAMDELDERYLGHVDPSCHPIMDIASRSRRAYNARDWDAWRECFADDFRLVDHRPAGWGECDLDDYMQRLQGFVELAPGVVHHWVEVGGVAPRAALGRLLGRGTSAEGGSFEVMLDVVSVIVEGRIARSEFFSVEDRARALQRFEALSGGGPGTDLVTTLNEAARRWVALTELMAAGEVEEIMRRHAPDATLEERRLNSRETHDRSGLRAWMGWVTETVEIAAVDIEVLAVRGDHLVASVPTYSVTDDLSGEGEVEWLVVSEFDDAGLMSRAVIFEPDEIDAGMVLLDEWFAESVPSEILPTRNAMFSFGRAYAERDWSAVRALLADDFVLVDHRPGWFGTLGPDEYVERLRGLVELTPDLVLWNPEVPRLTPGAALGRVAARGSGPEGGQVEIVFDLVGTVREGRITRFEFYGSDERARALARFDELAGAGAEPGLDNQALRRITLWGKSLVGGDLEATLAFYADDAVVDERRYTSRETSDSHQLEQWVRWVHETFRFTDVGIGPVAVRGDHLALARHTFRFSDESGSESEICWLQVTEIDEADLVAHATLLEPDDLDAAFDELDARYRAQLDDASQLYFDLTLRVNAAYRARDIEAYRELLSDDLVLVDHRPAGWGTLGAAEYCDHLGGLFGLADEIVSRQLEMEVTPNGGYGWTQAIATGLAGGTVEISFCAFAVADDSGRFSRIELFPLEDRARARARFRELVAPPSADSSADSLAVRAARANAAAVFAGDAAGAAEWAAEDVVMEDRRPLVGELITGRDELRRMTEVMLGTPSRRLEVDPLATRGRRWALVRVDLEVEPPWGGSSEIAFLRVDEVDAGGLIVRSVAFEPDDVEDAYDQLDQWFRDALPGDQRDMIDLVVRGRQIYNAHDWTALRSFLTDDFVVVDHRPGWFGTLDADAYVERTAGILSVAPDASIHVTDIPRVAPNAAVIRWSTTGTNEEGGPFEITFDSVAVRAGDRIARFEFFDVADRGEALSRFEELAGDDPGRSRGSPSDLVSAPNQALRVMEQIHECVRTGDFEGMVSHHAPDIVFEERRQTIKEEYGSEQLQAWGEWMREVGVRYEDVRFEALAVRGERLCLGLQTYHVRDDTGGGTEISWLLVTELNDDGLVSRFVMLEPDDAVAAHVELDERYDALLPPDHVATRRALFASGWAYLDRDWDGFRATLSDDFVFVDHRPAGWGVCDADTYVEHLSSLMGLAPDVDLFTPEIPRLTAGAALFRTVSRATGPAGGVVEFVIDHVSTVSGGRVTREEFFPPERRDEAVARFEQLARLGSAGPAVQVWARFVDALESGDLSGLAELVAPGYTDHDHINDVVIDAAAALENQRVVASAANLSIEWEAVLDLGRQAAWRARYRWSVGEGDEDGAWNDDDMAEHGSVMVGVVDESGRGVESHRFAEDQVHAALAVVERHNADNASDSDDAAASRRFAGLWTVVDAYNAGDWGSLRSMCAENIVVEDHRPAGWGTVEGAARIVELLRELGDRSAAARWIVQHLLYRGRRSVALTWSLIGVDQNEGSYELAFAGAVLVDDDGRMARVDLFPAERLSDARDAARAFEG